MDYGQAKTILARIFREYKAFQDLEAVIEFANMQEQRKEVLEKEIGELVAERGSQVGSLEKLTAEVSSLEKKLKDSQEEADLKQRKLLEDEELVVKAYDLRIQAKKDEFSKEATRLDEALEDAENKLKILNGEIRVAEAQLKKAQAAYKQFKDSI